MSRHRGCNHRTKDNHVTYLINNQLLYITDVLFKTFHFDMFNLPAILRDLSHSSLANYSSSSKLHDFRAWTLSLSSCHRFLMGFRSGLSGATCPSTKSGPTWMCFGLLSCWKTQCWSNLAALPVDNFFAMKCNYLRI